MEQSSVAVGVVVSGQNGAFLEFFHPWGLTVVR